MISPACLFFRSRALVIPSSTFSILTWKSLALRKNSFPCRNSCLLPILRLLHSHRQTDTHRHITCITSESVSLVPFLVPLFHYHPDSLALLLLCFIWSEGRKREATFANHSPGGTTRGHRQREEKDPTLLLLLLHQRKRQHDRRLGRKAEEEEEAADDGHPDDGDEGKMKGTEGIHRHRRPVVVRGGPESAPAGTKKPTNTRTQERAEASARDTQQS